MITVKPLNIKDINEIRKMDDMSGFYVAQWVEEMDENNDYSWGIYDDNILMGYCTIGYADDVYHVIEQHPLYNNNAYLLSDVYMKPEYRHKNFGLKLITETIQKRFALESKQPVFLEVMYDDLKNFYAKAGFTTIDDTECMIYIPESE
mgnify:FL=1